MVSHFLKGRSGMDKMMDDFMKWLHFEDEVGTQRSIDKECLAGSPFNFKCVCGYEPGELGQMYKTMWEEGHMR